MTAPGSNPMARWLEDVWLGRYLDRELSDEEQTWFETYMLDKPRILELVDADTRLREGMARISEPSSTAISAPPQQSGATLRGKPRGPALAIAASLLLGLGLGTILPGMRIDSTAIIASPPRVVFDTMRGEGTTTLSEPGSADSKVLIVDIATPVSTPVISASAWIEGRQTVLPTPTVSSEGFVTFVVPADWRNRARIDIRVGSAAAPKSLSFQL
jgi:hypothetical protein